jgi:hypothetical protein
VIVPLASEPVSLASDLKAVVHDRIDLLDHAEVVVIAVAIAEEIVVSAVVTKVEIEEIEADIRAENAVVGQRCIQVVQANDQEVRASVPVDPLIAMDVLEIAAVIAVADQVRAADNSAIVREDQEIDRVDQAFVVVVMTSAVVDVAMIA